MSKEIITQKNKTKENQMHKIYINPKSITFMDELENLIPTNRKDYKNKRIYQYVPNWDKMLETSSCKEETEKIKQMMNRKHDIQFVYQICFMAYTYSHYRKCYEWQIFQHPWYKNAKGEKVNKDIMIDKIINQYGYAVIQSKPNK